MDENFDRIYVCLDGKSAKQFMESVLKLVSEYNDDDGDTWLIIDCIARDK
jgi:hypothetical protein